ncbi:DUF3500 domain-containing protein [Phytoactinopolyspora mesophila]|uniref:DUF3500 domain-containing protein n=1 Tax=Phytoactinopolyspora mesophila TaxID=2650750 RepID=A0A7K3LXI9_9ACTN|nr:DUF3500 domain-containing protein [Phytoactinopolyspora mesophila]NDL55744.1 DUF3500 domain-containing protein [Phytoactinopolyspora mesophila]
MSDVPTAAAREMSRAAAAFLDSLDAGQRRLAWAPFDAADRTEFTYLPGPRPGLALSEISERQHELAMRLLATGLSSRGLADAKAIMQLEDTLAALERAVGRPGWQRRNSAYYWFRVLGTPGGAEPWMWKAGGHHLAVHMTVVGSDVAGTPQFFGANPARVPDGHAQAGTRTLPGEEDLGRALVTSLPAEQQEIAVVSGEAPADILTRHDPVADASRIAPGLLAGDMDGEHRELLEQLVRRYVERVTPAAAAPAWADIKRAGLERVSFRWAGPTAAGPGNGHYYAVLGPTFLLEYDNTQADANHIHTVWRDLRRDWGEDLLARHYAAHQV